MLSNQISTQASQQASKCPNSEAYLNPQRLCYGCPCAPAVHTEPKACVSSLMLHIVLVAHATDTCSPVFGEPEPNHELAPNQKCPCRAARSMRRYTSPTLDGAI